MTVEITGIVITDESIKIEAVSLENLLFAEDLFEDAEAEPVTFAFDRHAKHGAEMKYLYKVCQSQKKCQSAKSMGEKLEKLVGVILNMSEGFKVA